MKKFKQYMLQIVFSGSIMSIDDIIEFHREDLTPHEIDFIRENFENKDSFIIDDYEYVLHESKFKKFIKKITNKIKL